MEERRKSSVSSLDPERLAKLQQLKAFQKGSLASKLLKLKSNISGADEVGGFSSIPLFWRKEEKRHCPIQFGH